MATNKDYMIRTTIVQVEEQSKSKMIVSTTKSKKKTTKNTHGKITERKMSTSSKIKMM